MLVKVRELFTTVKLSKNAHPGTMNQFHFGTLFGREIILVLEVVSETSRGRNKNLSRLFETLALVSSDLHWFLPNIVLVTRR